MYCSQTYAMGVGDSLSIFDGDRAHLLQNLEVFFCLYAHHWNNPAQCNSQHSRILGFLSTVPGIWRGLQCLRRYYDTRNAFPHLVNFGKYTFTILCYMSLSLYRIDQTFQLKALFIACATVNSVYCCMSKATSPCSKADMFLAIWDIAMDWSMEP